MGLALVASGLLLSGCEMGRNSSDSQETMVLERPGVTLKGKVSEGGGKLFLQSEGKTTEIVSKKVDLKSRVGTEVEVYGEFSGTTLYVDEVN